MRLPTSRLRHRLQLGTAIVASVSAVWIVSRAVRHLTTPAPLPMPAVLTYPVPVPLPPPVMPPVVPVVPAVAIGPHLSFAFSAALREGDLKELERTYTSESSIDLALKAAAGYGKREVVKWVLDKGADVHLDELETSAPILQADAFPEVTALLLERGAAEPPLVTAATACAPNAVSRILAKDKKAATANAEATPIVDVINSGFGTCNEKDVRRSIVSQLLAAGADPNAGDPLGAAFGRCSSDEDECLALAKALLAKRARVSGEALGSAMDIEEAPLRSRMLDALLAGQLAPDATATAMGHVTGETEPALLRRLTSRGVAWTYHDGENDAVSPLVDAVERQDVALVRVMLDAGAPADHHYKDGRCALGSAIDGAGTASAEVERIVELLVARGASANRRLPDGRPPLFAAAEGGDVRVVKALLGAGARVNERVLDETALDAAERSGHTSVARVLDGHGGRRAPERPEVVAQTGLTGTGLPKSRNDDAVDVLRQAMGGQTDFNR